MIVLSFVERARIHDLCLDRLVEAAGSLNRFLRRLGGAALFSTVDEDRGPVLVATVAELPVFRERVDVVPENLQQLLVADLRRIIDNLDRFRVAGAAGGHLPV